jgi:murein L,D-transpeptidase YcbB/YkuD
MFAILKNFKPGPVLPVYGLIIILVLLLMPQYVFASDSRTGDTRELLRKTVENFVAGQEIKIADETLFARVMLPRFYLEREYYPAWIGSKGIGRDAYELIDEIKKADLQGLNPKDYHLDTIVTKINSLSNSAGPSSAGGLAEIDLLLTDAYLIYASHLLSGRVNPETLDPEWQANRRERDMAAWLREALEKHKIAASLYELLPLHRCYGSLLKALIVHRQIAEAGGWPEVPGVSVDLGGSAPEVKILRQRLAASGDLPDKQAGAPE